MTQDLVLAKLEPEPAQEWRRMLRFVGWGAAEQAAAARSIEPLFRAGPELVAGTYAYLAQVPETAAILGWNQGVDQAHLEERRRFFTIWLARTLGLDTSDEFAYYLFRAGQYHAGHGPRRVHVPPEYVTGSIGLVLAAFAATLAEAGLPGPALAAAMAAWNKLLSVQLNQMLLGYRVAERFMEGALPVACKVFGRLRPLVGRPEVAIHTTEGAPVKSVLAKFFDYYPQARAEVLEVAWQGRDRPNTLWLEVEPTYRPRFGWRVLLNGRDLEYGGGWERPLHAGDEVALFPPGR